MFLEEWEWRPKQVNLFIFTMTSSFSARTELRDNYWEYRWSNYVPRLRAAWPLIGTGSGRDAPIMRIRRGSAESRV